MDDPKGESPLVLARAGGMRQVTRGLVLTFLKNAVDDASSDRRAKILALYAFLLTANALVWIWAMIALAGRPTLIGTAILAYVLGLRHAVDADHIASIDNVVRKLMQEGKRPYSVGLFFSLGHSLAITIAVAGIAAAAFALSGRFAEFKSIGSVIGTGASAFFLLAIAVINLVILRGVWQSFRAARRGKPVAEQELNALLSGRGFLARIFRPLFRMVSRSWQMFPVGFLFGLGFDTATEISLFTVAASQASGGMTFGTVMIFPALFTAGMTLVDTTDSVLMVGAYGWAFLNPIRKIWYNLTITAISVVVALVIGGIEALGLVGEKLRLEGMFWDTVGALNDDLANFGYLVVGILLASWAVSYLIYRYGGLDRPLTERARG
ncbi:MAG TPA: HoxN/HupN/NixA family nickel/cobalt transporter [Xanthobacteraceae bacterium]|nr:HoxN/HupN/NixA family nickel/cobalt transporter [Xanthobacteraceae bacterium]